MSTFASQDELTWLTPHDLQIAHPLNKHFVSLQNNRTCGFLDTYFQVIQRFNAVPFLLHRHSLIYTITKGLFESKANHPYRKSDDGICSSIDSIKVTIR
ncbi:MAG: hypothetical protein KF751_19785, partial [Nitrospira sp.]|nr:hypothetical protein [Nitrospira sp.]